MNRIDTENINKGALEYNKEVAPILKEIFEPFSLSTGITFFNYNRFVPGQRYLTLSMDGNAAEGYFANDFDNCIFFEKQITLPEHSKRSVFWDVRKDNELLDFLRGHNYWHGLTIFSRLGDTIESWNFATDRNNTEINQFYINQQTLMDQFILYFNEKASSLIYDVEEDKLASYKNNRCLDFSAFDNTGYKDLQETLMVKKYPFVVGGETIKICQGEFDCLVALSEGLSLKSIANSLNLSPRTVESYLNNAKLKLGKHSKDELIKAYRQSIYPNLFSK